jgi:hypothetical protein
MNEDQTPELEQLNELPIFNDKVIFQPIEEMEDGADIVEDDNYREIDDNDEEDYTLAYKEWATSLGIEVDDNIEIKDAKEFEDKVANYYIEKKFGKDNQLLELAKSNVDINQVMNTYAQYDQVIAMDDRDLYISAQATDALNDAVKKHPQLNSQEAQQEYYNKLVDHFSSKVKNADNELLASLAQPIRAKYQEAKDNLIPSIKTQQSNMQKEYEKEFMKKKETIKSKIKDNPFYAEKKDLDLMEYFDNMTSFDKGKTAFENKLENDPEFYRKMIELSYLEEKGLLEKTLTKKTIKGKYIPPKLRNSSGSIGLRMIDTSKKH